MRLQGVVSEMMTRQTPPTVLLPRSRRTQSKHQIHKASMHGRMTVRTRSG